jgi:hypothetical protein
MEGICRAGLGVTLRGGAAAGAGLGWLGAVGVDRWTAGEGVRWAGLDTCEPKSRSGSGSDFLGSGAGLAFFLLLALT